MSLAAYVETLNLLGDESRIRLCALLRERELCVSDLVRVTGMAQSRVSTHLGRLREAGFVWDRRHGAQCFYGLALDALPGTARAVLDEAARSEDPTLTGDLSRLRDLEAERRGGLADSVADELYCLPAQASAGTVCRPSRACDATGCGAGCTYCGFPIECHRSDGTYCITTCSESQCPPGCDLIA